MRSVLQSEKRCWQTGTIYNLHEHHIFGGTRRGLSEKYGLKVYLRWDLHELAHRDGAFALRLKRAGQRAFEREHSREQFMRIFGKSYIWEEQPPESREQWEFRLTGPVELPY